MDGAFIVTGAGVVEAAGRYITVDVSQVNLPGGPGSRHSSVAGITSCGLSKRGAYPYFPGREDRVHDEVVNGLLFNFQVFIAKFHPQSPLLALFNNLAGIGESELAK